MKILILFPELTGTSLPQLRFGSRLRGLPYAASEQEFAGKRFPRWTFLVLGLKPAGTSEERRKHSVGRRTFWHSLPNMMSSTESPMCRRWDSQLGGDLKCIHRDHTGPLASKVHHYLSYLTTEKVKPSAENQVAKYLLRAVSHDLPTARQSTFYRGPTAVPQALGRVGLSFDASHLMSQDWGF